VAQKNPKLTLKEGFHHAVRLTQRSIQGCGIFSAGLGQIGAAAAFPTDLLGHQRNDFSGLDAGGQILGDTDNQ